MPSVPYLIRTKLPLATRLGMTPESLSRAFRELSGMGVNARGKTISVADIDRLREFCHYDDLH